MKKLTMMATVIMAIAVHTVITAQSLSAANASPQPRTYDCKVDKGLANLLVALRSENQGLTESAMKRVAEIKMLYPERNITETKKVIDSLSVHANIPAIRYKAYLASNACDNPEWYANKVNINSDTEFFDSVDSQLHAKILGSRTN